MLEIVSRPKFVPIFFPSFEFPPEASSSPEEVVLHAVTAPEEQPTSPEIYFPTIEYLVEEDDEEDLQIVESKCFN